MSSSAEPRVLESITITNDDATVFILPARGGMVTRFMIGERHVLYLDESTVIDTKKNVRGGNPVLFPSPGKLEGDRFTRGDKSGSMGQHGFARNHPWSIVERTASSLTLRLTSNDATRAVFPWDFVATYRYSLTNKSTLRIDQTFESTGDDAMGFGAGFHPYFEVAQADKSKARVLTKATRAWDNAKKAIVDLNGPIDLTADEVDLHLIDHDGPSATLDLGDGHQIVVRGSDAYRRWVVWTLAGKSFVCLEPWTCAANALNTGASLIEATRSKPATLFTEIEFV